jgi:hypothetical protein
MQRGREKPVTIPAQLCRGAIMRHSESASEAARATIVS